MPNTFRVQTVGQVNAADVGRDYIANVLWYITDTTPASSVGDALNAAFAGSAGPYYGFYNVWTKVYDHTAPLHSPPVYTKLHNGAGGVALGPRQVAICLSFYSGLNVRGQRGRIYVGPWNSAMMAEYVPAGAASMMDTLMGQLKTPGGPDVVHQIHHPARGAYTPKPPAPIEPPRPESFTPVTNYFWNNRWDTMRSRLPKETSRHHSP